MDFCTTQFLGQRGAPGGCIWVRLVVFLLNAGLWDAKAGAAVLGEEKPACSLLFGGCKALHSLKQPQPSHLLQHGVSGAKRQIQTGFIPKDDLNPP